MTSLRPYQRAAIDATYDYWASEGGSPLIEMATGTGKSVVIATLIRELLTRYPQMRVLSLVHVRELVQQNAEALLRMWPGAPVGINSAGLGRRDTGHPILFASIQSVHRHAARLGRRDLVLVDECFVAGTMVSTPFGPVPIEKITPGDAVYNATGIGFVRATSRNQTNHLTVVETSDGRVIRCTENHPFFTERGWVKASGLEIGSRLFRKQDLRNLRSDFYAAKQRSERQCDQHGIRAGLAQKDVLFKNMCGSSFKTRAGQTNKLDEAAPSKLGTRSSLCSDKGMSPLQSDFPTLDERRASTNASAELGKTALLLDILLEEARKCHERPRDASKNGCNAETRWTQTIDSYGKWNWTDSSSNDSAFDPWIGMGAEFINQDRTEERIRAPDIRQAHCRSQTPQDRHPCLRIHDERTTGSDNEEIRVVDIHKLDCSSYEQKGSGEFVYNLDVSGHPSYFAHGILVHNCHLLPAHGEGMYHELLKEMQFTTSPDLRLFGCTATPYRLDSGRLDRGEGRLFDRICYTYGIGEGVRDGFLSPLVSKAGSTEIDVGQVARRGGEFVAGALAAAADKDETTRAAVAEIVAHGQARRSWLLFASSVAHAHNLALEVRRHGVTCEVVTGETPREERARILRAFKSGQIRALANMSVLTTGFDAPQVDLVAMLRPTCSTGLYVQMLGRGTRLASGKSNCLVLDFSGNVRRHGPVDDIEVRDKAAKGTGVSEAAVRPETVAARPCPNCMTYNPTRAISCEACSLDLREEPKHEAVADTAPVMTGRSPLDWREVDDVTYVKHVKFGGGTPSLKVTYASGRKRFNEFWCFDHPTGSFPRRKAEGWWKEQGGASPPPESVDAAVRRQGELSPVDAIRVAKDGEYDRVVARRTAQARLLA